MVYELIFSATGRSEKVLDIISAHWNGEKVRVDLSAAEPDMSALNITAEDFCIVNVSVFEGRIPHPALKNLQKISGNGAKALLVAVFGNRAVDDCLLEMKDVLTAQGFVPVAAIEASVQHSIINRVCPDRPDADDIQELNSFAQQVKTFVDDGGTGALNVPGNFPYIEMGGVKFKPAADNMCIECGLCVQKCPAQAIPLDNPRITDKDICITCMRCIEICPVSARQLPHGIAEMAYERMAHKFAGRKPNRLYLAE